MRAEGLTGDGKVVQERPQALALDEKEHPIVGAPYLREIATNPIPTQFTSKQRTPTKWLAWAAT